MRGKPSVRKGVWYIGGRRKRKRRAVKRQRKRGIPIGLFAPATVPFSGEVAKPILKKIFGGRKKRR